MLTLTHRRSEARYVASRIVTALKDCKRNPVFREFVLTEYNGHVILFAVLDELRLGEPVNLYFAPEVLHQIGTLTGGKRVAVSNHNGARYAVLLSASPKLPKVAPFPEHSEADTFPLGVSRQGLLHARPERLLNAIIGGATRSGKSIFETNLAYTACLHGHDVYLVDPQRNTFSSDWENVAAAPLASSVEEFTQLIQSLHTEMSRRETLFLSVRKPSGLKVQKIEDYNQFAPTPLRRIFLIVDEANSFMDKRGVSDAIADLARQSLKYGIHVILAAHSWRSQDVPRSLSGSFATRVTFRVEDDTSGVVVLDNSDWGQRAMRISQDQKGRGVIRLNGQYSTFQAYMLSEERLAGMLSSRQRARMRLVSQDVVDLVRRAFAPARPAPEQGRMTLEDLSAWGLGINEARRLGETWERRGWLEKRANQARFVTETLKAMALEPMDVEAA